MSQTESNNPLGSMISQLLSNPQQMQQLQQMAASLGLTTPNDNGAASACPQNESSNGTTPVSPNLSSLLGALSSPPPSQNTPALPALDSRMVGTIQKVMQLFSQSNPKIDFLRALRPLLSEQRAKKIDDAIRVMQLVQALPLLKESGIFGGDAQ